MTPENKNDSKSQKWRRILVHELFEFFCNFAFLSGFLVAFAWYRRLLLAGYHIQYLDYWAPVIEAAILAKVIMIGDALRIGQRFQDNPWPLLPFIARWYSVSWWCSSHLRSVSLARG